MIAIILLNAVAVTGSGATSSLVNGPRPETAQFVITGTATVKLQGSLNGSDWDDIVTATASGGYASIPKYDYYRGNVTSWTSGTVTLSIGGF